jgi:single-strand DNA-binding protein
VASLNKVMIIGNLGRDPELRYTPNGAAVTEFSVAATRTYTGQDGERHEETEWFNVVCWNKNAEIASQYLAKGRQVYVEGRLRTRSWDGPDGNKRYKTEVVADRFVMLGQRGDGERGGGAVPEPDQMVDPDDLPF